MSPCGWWALTPPSHPYQPESWRFFSSALINPRGLLPIKKRNALCCPDFPPAPHIYKDARDKPPGCFGCEFTKKRTCFPPLPLKIRTFAHRQAASGTGYLCPPPFATAIRFHHTSFYLYYEKTSVPLSTGFRRRCPRIRAGILRTHPRKPASAQRFFRQPFRNFPALGIV